MPDFLLNLSPAFSQEAGKATLLNNDRVAGSERRQRIDTNTLYTTSVYVSPTFLPGQTANSYAQLSQDVVVCPDGTPATRACIVGFDNESDWRDAAELFGTGIGSNTIRMRVSDSASTDTFFSPYDWTNKSVALPNITGGISISGSEGVVAVLEVNTTGSLWAQISNSSSVYIDYSMFECGNLPPS